MSHNDLQSAKTWFRAEYWKSACELAQWVRQAPSYVDRETLTECLLENYEFDERPDLELDPDSVYIWCYEEFEELLDEALAA